MRVPKQPPWKNVSAGPSANFFERVFFFLSPILTVYLFTNMEHQRNWVGTSPGTLVWVSDQDEAYVPGAIKSINGASLSPYIPDLITHVCVLRAFSHFIRSFQETKLVLSLANGGPDVGCGLLPPPCVSPLFLAPRHCAHHRPCKSFLGDQCGHRHIRETAEKGGRTSAQGTKEPTVSKAPRIDHICFGSREARAL